MSNWGYVLLVCRWNFLVFCVGVVGRCCVKCVCVLFGCSGKFLVIVLLVCWNRLRFMVCVWFMVVVRVFVLVVFVFCLVVVCVICVVVCCVVSLVSLFVFVLVLFMVIWCWICELICEFCDV